MKKILCFIAAMLLLTGCSAGNQSEKADGVASDSVKNMVSGSSENEGSGVEENSSADAGLSDEEILDELEGVYVTTEYIEEFGKTKSIESVYHITPLLHFYEADGGYAVMPSDFHQGSEELKVVSVDELDNGKYSVKTEKASYVGECEIIYTPGESTVKCILNGEEKMLTTGGEMKSFEHFKSFAELGRVMSEIVFEGANGIEFSDDEVFADINGERCSLSFANDYTGICADGIDMSSYDGAFFMKKASSGDSVLVRYKCDNSAVTLTDLDGNVVAEFKK